MRKILILLVVLVVFISSCNKPEVKTNETSQEEDEKTTAEMTKELCDEARGHWNECGSPCAGTGAEICIQMCSAQCECGGIAGFRCPNGYNCRLSGKIAADEIGVCVKGVVFDD